MSEPDLSYIHESLRSLAVPISTLTPDPKNARKHNRRNLDAIKASLEKFGMRGAVVVQRRGDALIVRSGNGRVTAASELGWTHLPATVFDEGDDEAVAFAIADNRTAELAEWDTVMLSELIEELDGVGFGGDVLGWTSDEIDVLNVRPSEEKEQPEQKSAPRQVTVRVENVPPSVKADLVVALNAALVEVTDVQAIAY